MITVSFLIKNEASGCLKNTDSIFQTAGASLCSVLFIGEKHGTQKLNKFGASEQFVTFEKMKKMFATFFCYRW